MLSCGWGEGAPAGVMQLGVTYLGLEWQNPKQGMGAWSVPGGRQAEGPNKDAAG